ncbi:hypothetical protein AMAG_02422 [Allomyces macrogynus ATCC 38327]|uniref:Uncharacterized protein n=1 Tax=Allomyces macrogynus (strain ATCC 38327) TaxID=578462 RepID=A0A0L0S2P5_ALLM3|nr:hypothetical protein AMAG_02422 [Allomyces macrogynus ATCC 38327]|eukprot:KNE56634.1 hypothetical protein AMAG_02422 [Allomyces macrogynus ATCC 38327]
MYSRSARKFIEPNRATNAEIGPGYYEPDGTAATTALGAVVLPSTAPFSSITPRVCYFDEVARRSGPAPGCYDTANVDPHHQPVRAVPFAASKAPRFADPPPKAPGPGAYSVERDRARQLRTLRLSQLKPAGSGMTGARGGGSSDGPRIKWQRKYTPPSIPYGAQAVGYEETDDGSLLLRRTQSATDNSARLVGHKDLLRENAGTNFTKSQTRRQLWRETDTPGPGNYNVTAAWRKPDSFPNHEAPCVRFGDFVINEANRQAVPGPGSYDLPKDSTAYLKRGPILAKSTTHGITPTSDPFSVVPYPADTSPGPGAYDVTAATHPRKPLHLGAKPFNTSATRFNPSSTPTTPSTTTTPGPGQILRHDHPRPGATIPGQPPAPRSLGAPSRHASSRRT